MATSKIGFYGHVRQYHDLKTEIDQAIEEVLESGSYVLGPQLVTFEEELAGYLKVEEAVGLNSGTDALLLAFLALGLGPGDEIITTERDELSILPRRMVSDAAGSSYQVSRLPSSEARTGGPSGSA
jgi:hypothetical protein